MGEFRRQPSRVWWSSFPEDNDYRIHSFSDWGNGIDLSHDASSRKNLSEGDICRREALSLEPGLKKEATEWEESKSEPGNWQNSDVSNDRGCSSSPSQGSHKSQDSGFSDSEIHANPTLHSPEDSPELSGRKCSVSEKQESTIISKFKNIHIKNGYAKHYLETNLDEPEEKVREFDLCCTSVSKQSIFTKIRNNSEKINKIQNQLELSFKFPRKSSVAHSKSISTLISTQLPSNPSEGSACQDGRKSAVNNTVIELPKRDRRDSELDSEGFKIPKTLVEQNANYKGSDNFLNLTHFEGPPISSSTPKSTKFRRQESPIPKAARATEKKIGSMSTFATIRKLKGISDKKIKRPISLFPSFNRSKVKEAPKRRSRWDASTRQWLSELGSMYEAEIMTTLQSKSLATDLTRQVTSMAATTSETVRKLHQKTKTISAEFSRVFQHKKMKNYKQIAPLVQSLIGHIKEFVENYVQNSELIPRNENQRKPDQEKRKEVEEMVTDFREPEPETKAVGRTYHQMGLEVVAACEALRQVTHSPEVDENAIEDNLTELGRKFTSIVDMILLTHVKALVHALEEPKTELALRTALSALTSLDLEGNLLSQLVARSEGVRALLAVCLEGRATAVRVMALRALTVVCCVAETIKQFEQAGGLEIICDLLGDSKRSEEELSEAVAVLAQITAPWIKDNQSLQSLSSFLGDLVKSLTRVVKECKSSETLLLSAAALANLTFMEPRTVWPLLENQTAKILLSAVRRQGPKVSVFIQEQAATVIANMASVPECRKHLADNRAVVALLCFLQIRHSPFQRLPEIAAAERVQQKSAIALSRLCSDSTVAKQVVELQGVLRLVRLCKEERERNNSDGVLVACLAALRKIVANCGTETLEKLEAMELVEPRLLDSFLLYSSKQESYV